MEIEILYDDPQITLCLKSPGIDSETGMPALLRERLGGEHYCVHRLDKQVGGVMVYARTKQAAAALSAAIAAGRMKKGYLALAQGVPEEKKGSMRDLLYHDAARNKSYVVTRRRTVCLTRDAARRRRALRKRVQGSSACALVREPALSASGRRPGNDLFRAAARSFPLDGV